MRTDMDPKKHPLRLVYETEEENEYSMFSPICGGWEFVYFEDIESVRFIDAYGQLPTEEQVHRLFFYILNFYKFVENNFGGVDGFNKLVREKQREAIELRRSWKDIEICSDESYTTGYVYLIKHDSDYKIGKASNLDRRIKQISPVMPKPLNCICAIKTNKPHSLEKKLHEKYAEYRLNGEWFSLPDDAVEEIIEISNVPTEVLP